MIYFSDINFKFNFSYPLYINKIYYTTISKICIVVTYIIFKINNLCLLVLMYFMSYVVDNKPYMILVSPFGQNRFAINIFLEYFNYTHVYDIKISFSKA